MCIDNNAINNDYERLQDLILLFGIPMDEKISSKFIDILSKRPLKF